MGQLTQTTAQVQTILDNSDAANVGKTSLTDSTDTTAVAVRKSGFYSLGASSSNAPSTDRAILISAVRDTTATGEIRYGQVAITESNGMWWNRDDGGALGTWYEAVSTAGAQTLTNKTLTSPVLTTPQINDTSANHQYVFAVSELAADRTVTLPLLTGNDTFVFEAHTQTLTNKTLTTPTVSGLTLSDASIIFEGATANDHETTLTVTDPTADRTITLPDATDTLVGRATTDTLTNKTLTSPVASGLTLSDASIVFEGATADAHETTLTVTDPTADRTITLPNATDTLVGLATTDTLTNKTLTSPVLNTSVSGSAVLDEDDMSSNSATQLATQQSIKAYVDAQVAGSDTLAEVLSNGNTTGSTDIVVTAGQSITTDTIAETTSAAGVTVDSLLIKDGGITAAGTSTFAGQTISDLGTVTTANIDGGSIDGTTIGAATAAAGTFTTVTADGGVSVDNITIDGTEIDLSSGDLTIDVAGQIALDADGGEIQLKDGGTEFGQLAKSGNDFRINHAIQDGNIVFRGNDGGVVITALTISMQDAGAATFNSSATATSFVTTAGGTFTTASGNDLNIVYPSTRSLFIKEGSETHVTVDNTGQVGIGTTSPASPLHVNVGTDLNFEVENSSSTLRLSALNDARSANIAMQFASSSFQFITGDVIVGAGSGNAALGIKSGTSNTAKINFGDSSNDDAGIITYTNDSGGSDNMAFTVGTSEAVRILHNGKLLIGDSASHTSDLLQIETPASGGGHGIQIRRNDANGDQTIGTISFGNNTDTDLATISAKTDGDGNSGDSGALLFSTQPTGGSLTERLRITSTGKIGINENSPDLQLHIKNTATGSTGIAIENTNNAQNLDIDFYNNTGSAQGRLRYAEGAGSFSLFSNVSATEALTVTYGGNVGIGSTAVDRGKLHVNHIVQSSDGAFSDPHIALSFSSAPTDNDSFAGISYATSDSDNYGWTVGAERTSSGLGDFIFTQHNNSATGSEKVRIDSNGVLFLGVPGGNSTAIIQGTSGAGSTNQPGTDLQLKGGSGGGTGGSKIRFFTAPGGSSGTSESAATEVAQFDESGDLRIGKNESGFTAAGHVLFGVGSSYHIRDNGTVAYFKRLTGGGDILDFRQDSATVGSIATYSSTIQVGQGNVYLKFDNSTDTIRPTNGVGNDAGSDDSIDLGSGSARFDDIYATNPSIQTSDRNEKQDIEALTAAEQRVASACRGLLRKFRWKSAVTEKGDDARIHFGIIAQDLQAAFEAEGLDAGRYAMFINSTWTDEETGEERSRMGVRYSELLAFIIAAI